MIESMVRHDLTSTVWKNIFLSLYRFWLIKEEKSSQKDCQNVLKQGFTHAKYAYDWNLKVIPRLERMELSCVGGGWVFFYEAWKKESRGRVHAIMDPKLNLKKFKLLFTFISRKKWNVCMIESKLLNHKRIVRI